MSWIPPMSARHEYSDWPIESEGDWEYVGTSERGTPVFYDRETETLHRGRVDEAGKQLIPDETPSWEIDPGETLGAVLERIGREIGWESLSAFARDYLEDDAGT